MSEELSFRFSIQGLPEGEALTGAEIEQRLLEALDSSNGTCLDSLWSLAVFYQRSGLLDQATGCIHRFLDLTEDPEQVGAAYLALGQLEESKADFASAASAYRRALASEPCSAPTWYFIHNNLGYSLNQLGDYESAVHFLARALEIDPERPNAYKNMALAKVALGDLEKAAELFIAATQVDASDPRSLRHLEDLLEEHPTLEIDVPDLREQLEACRKAVEFARSQQPDVQAYWAKLRKEQKPK